MNSNIKHSNQKALFIALIALGFLMGACLIFINKSDQISFKEKLKTKEQIFVENLIQRAELVLQKNHELSLQIQTEKRSIAVDQYNKIANDYNALNSEINTSPFFNQHMELKKIFLGTNNEASAFLESTKNALSTSKAITNISNPTEFIKKYEVLKKHPAIHEFSFLNFNKATFEFLAYLFSFAFLSLVSTVMYSRYNSNLKNLLIQKESELKTFLSVIDNMSEGVIVSDRFGFFTYYNQSALDIIGPNIKDIYYQSSLDLIGFHDVSGSKLQKTDSPFHKAVRKNIVTDQEILVNNQLHPQGIYISASNGFYVDEKGETLGAVVVMKNISHKKHMEELWKREKESAIDGSQKKSDFLASMSHEIRTPMNGIIGLTTVLSETNLDEQQIEFVQIIRRSAKALLSLINDILDHSKIESGKIELVQSNFDIQFLIKDVLENFKQSGSEKNNQISFETPKNFEKYYVADENRIRQIMMNLVGNAAKFTVNGQITVKIDVESQGQIESRLRFSVSDTGPGMTKNELERLFQRFFQTKTGIKFGGTGLGLSICKQLVDLMNGKIGVRSVQGVGSTFWFELPLQKGTPETSVLKNIKLSDYANTFSGHILVAEDNIINQKVVHQYLSKLGFTVDMANNGAEAYDLFEKNKYDLVLMDCNMPVMNGYQATEKINQFQKDHSSKVKIVALTADGQITGLEKALNSGMTDFINKPILIEEFVLTLKKYCGSFDKATLHKLKDLTVDDQLLIEVLYQEYSESTPQFINSMNQYLNSNDFESLSNQAHSLKSSSGSLGAKKVQMICETIEKCNCIETAEQLNVPKLLAELHIEFNQSLIDLQNEIQNIKNSSRIAS